MKKFQKKLALFLVILTVFTSIYVTMPVLASYDLVTMGNVTDGNVSEETAEESEVKILSEITEKREENAKHFRMSDGSYIVAQYNTPVHYLNENGEWADIDNTISEAQATTEQTELFGTDELYSTANGAENVVFAEKSNSNTLVSYEAKEYPISFNYQSAKKSYINVVDNKAVLEGDEAFLTLTDITQEVVYENVFVDVDLQYIVSPTGLKENIILKSESAQNSFTVNYNTGELTAEVVDSNTINLMAEDEVVYTISAPYMTDANGEKSEAVTLTVEKNKNGKLRLVIGADESWLSAEGRAYPVVVDPTITTETTRDAINSVMIAEAQPNTNYSKQSEMIVGREPSEYGYCRVLAKIQLPTLNKGDIIVGAQLNILNYGLWPYADSTPDMQVNAHVLTEDWSVSTVTWNNQPSYNSIVSDYDIFEETDDATWRKFDITKIAKQWYEEPDTNYGIMLKGANTTGTYAENGVKAYMYTERYNDIDDAYPQILLTYRNNKGLENYWTYTSLSAGGAGAAYINDYTGNLVFASNIISSSNELMPLSVDCVYNGYASNVKYTSGKDGSSLAVPGFGWRLSVQQTLLETEGDLNEKYPYVYTDGDGTDHYIYKNTEDDETVYEDEDGLGLTLTIQKDGSTVTGYTLTDKKDNKLIFNKQGNLIKVENSNGNYNEFVYDSTGKKLQKMIDGAGKEYTVTYLILNGSVSDYIDYITDPSDRKIDFSYSNGCLVTVSFAGETVASFTYADSANERSMLTAQDVDGYKLSFEYTATTNGKQVSYVTEYGKNNALGQKLGFRRDKYNTTEIQTAGSDGVYGNSNDLITTYQFDNFGRTVTQQLKTKGGTHSVAGLYEYTENEASSFKTANKVTSSASLGKNVVNHIIGGNAESASDWTFGNGNAVTAESGATATNAYIGNKSVYVNSTAVTASDSRAYLYQGITGLTAGVTYTLSAYVKTVGVTSVYDSDESGAHIFLRYVNSEGAPVYSYSEYINEATDEDIDGGWRRISATVTLPEGVTSLRAYLSLKDATGVAYFDCMQLEAGSVANDFNLLQNPSFEKSTSGLANKWSTSTVTYQASGETVNEGVSTKHNVGGSNSFVIEGKYAENKNIYQDVAIYGGKNDTYIVSGWARANAVDNTDNHSSSAFEIGVRVFYEDEEGNSYSEYKSPAKFNPDISGWQYTSGAFSVKSKDHPSYQPVKIRVILKYYSQVNYGYFDNIQLIKDVASSYTYDSEGNVVSVSANAEQKNNMEYEDSDLKTYTDVKGNETTYEYDAKHNLTKATSPGNVKTTFTYNSAGQQRATYIRNSAETVAIRTGIGYTEAKDGVSAGAYVDRVGDENGNLTTYDYDYLKGLTTKVTNAKGVATNYTYDSYDRLTGVSSAGSSVSYTYSGNKLNTINYGDDTYSFEYDSYGNVISTKINGKPLSTNTYGANNGVPEKTTYGNGTVRSYTYDSFGNMRSVKNTNGGTMYSWIYDSSMTPLVHRDAVNTLKYNYSYDSIGRLIRQTLSDNSTGDYIGATEYTYDLRNNVTKVVNEMGGRTASQWYQYNSLTNEDDDPTVRYEKENLPVRYLVSSDRYVDYTYDSLNRLTKKTLSLSTPLEIKYYYLNSDRGTDSSTNVVYKTTQVGRENIGSQLFKYAYDVLGNITSVVTGTVNDDDATEDASLSSYRQYKYDSLNQLTREDNATSDKTYVYEYDNFGNITQKKVYSRTFAEDIPEAKLEKTISYTYGTDTDAGWKNLLTSYNGEQIDYDAIGNPISYRGATLTWAGRELKSYSKDGTNVTYKYDADGLRASKTVNGEKTTYQYVGDQLLYENRNGTEIYYFYDSYGSPTAIRYYKADGTSHRFYLATNQQGDIIGIYNASGNLVVKYEYDAWGNIIAETNATGGTPTSLAQYWSDINPFRYRGYYYDAETELYYLQSRYYDAEVGRFISSDSLLDSSDLLGFNPFAYCGNNPVNREDSTGHFWDVALDIVSIVYSAYQVLKEPADVWNWVGLVVDVACAAVPVACGGGVAVRALSKGDDIVDTVKVATKVDDAYDGTRAMSKFSGGVCFIAGTPVLTENGYSNIEDVESGDKVWSTNPETGETELKEVVRTFINETKELVHVYVNDEEITTTPEHPFYVSNHGWVGAIDLRAGDKLVLVNGEFAVVEKVQHEILEQPIKVYNFEVEDFHTYYVGDTGVLVHNECGGLVVGKPSVPNGATRLRVDTRNVNSQQFKDFIRSQGKSFRSSEWKYKMETWVTETGEYIERHYWYNKSTGESYYHL